MERERRSGRSRRSRSHDDSLPSPSALDIELHDAITDLLTVRQKYVREYQLGLEAPGGSGIGVVAQSNATEAAWSSPENRAQRAKCRRAVRLLREAATKVDKALTTLGARAVQPEDVSDDSVIDQGTFDRALHLRRERELRT